MAGADARPTVVVNPLAVGLHHYVAELALALAPAGGPVVELSTDEPSSRADGSRVQWLKAYVGLLRKARRLQPARLIVTWPALGYWDFVVVRALLPRTESWVVLHDPRPLVYARGYGRLARRVASMVGIKARAIVHSAAARADVRDDASPHRLALLPHPIRPPIPPSSSRGANAPTVVRVLGQYKADRDVDALARLAVDAPRGWAFDIVGRGWPEVAGWTVSSRFVPEDEFDALIDGADVVLIPYRRFFQSGVALRALERSTAVVGPRDSSLSDLLGDDSPWLVDGGDWLPAVAAAVDGGGEAAHAAAAAEHTRVLASWKAWLDG